MSADDVTLDRSRRDRLVDSFTTAYSRLVRERVLSLGVDPSRVDAAVAAGQEWLHRHLTELLSIPFPEQSRGPLELVQEAMRFPTDALLAMGVARIPRDEVAEAALPGDVYGLAPVSSQELGEEAWHAHLAWGMDKAKAMTASTQARVVWYGTNLMDRSKVATAASARNLGLTALHDPDKLAGVSGTVLVDLEAPRAEEAIKVAAVAGARVVAYGPHVDDAAMVRARSLGAAEAVPRSRFFRRPEDYLPVIL